MPRIRTIKPEFWHDEKLAPLSAVDRLVFLGLISMADDAGRLVDNVKSIDGFLFSETEDSAGEAIERLAKLGRLLRYRSASGQRLIQIVNWERHQKVDNPAKYTLPGPAPEQLELPSVSEPSREAREKQARKTRDIRADVDLRPTTYDLRPTTTEPLPSTDEQRAATAPNSVATTLPLAAIEFGSRFYGKSPAPRRREVADQLIASLTPQGCVFNGATVRAGSPERLEKKCLAVMREGVRDPDKAIVVLLKKLGDVSDDPPTERAASDAKQEAAQEARATRAVVEPWIEAHRDDYAQLIAWSEKRFPGDDAFRVEMRRGWLLSQVLERARASPHMAGAP